MKGINNINQFFQDDNISFRDAISVMMKQGLQHYPKNEIENMVLAALNKESERPSLREYRDRFFKLLFSDKKRLLSLYNALNHSDYQDEDDLLFVTLEFGICIGMRNDLAFVLVSDLYIYEAQSTKNKNMPLRMLFYVADMYRNRIRHRDLFKNTRVMIETPHFVTFYNGDADMDEDEVILKLSDSYMRKSEDEEPELELKVRVLNINKGHNKELLEACESLNGYAELVCAARRYRKTELTIDNAVVSAIDYCIENNILKDFLSKYRDEVISMLKEFYTIEDFKQDLLDEVDEVKAQAEEARSQMEEARSQMEEARVQAEEARIQVEEARLQAEEANASVCELTKLLMESYKDLGIEKEQAIKLIIQNAKIAESDALEIANDIYKI